MPRRVLLLLAASLRCLVASPTHAATSHPPGLAAGDTYHRVFATFGVFGITSSTAYPPPFNLINSNAGADWQVTLAAFDAGLLTAWNGVDPIWTAIISDSTEDARDRFSIEEAIYNMADQKVADDSTDFWDGSLDTAIAYTEYGTLITTDIDVWSGSSALDTFSGTAAGDWSDRSSAAAFGLATVAGSSWLNSNFQVASNTARLYGISPPITVPKLGAMMLLVTSCVCLTSFRRRRRHRISQPLAS